jgi:hypothetical protein
MRAALRHFLLDRQGTLYHLPSAALDRMLHDPTRHRVARFAGQRVRARAELALALDSPAARHAGISDASTRFVARGGQWTPSAAVARRIEQIALGRQKCPRISPSRLE